MLWLPRVTVVPAASKLVNLIITTLVLTGLGETQFQTNSYNACMRFIIVEQYLLYTKMLIITRF
ncbi:Protein of unknown function, partial [Cotesia congregata]